MIPRQLEVGGVNLLKNKKNYYKYFVFSPLINETLNTICILKLSKGGKDYFINL